MKKEWGYNNKKIRGKSLKNMRKKRGRKEKKKLKGKYGLKRKKRRKNMKKKREENDKHPIRFKVKRLGNRAGKGK